ncbi:acyltransferase [Flavobacterium sp.]|uniref:acyltransferase family protein n=1 Tax=Flavobacterium sp. TaxID=239 RepID=UPI00263070FB|nr:acyltransferase [Flavobacterium sp.]
MGEQITPNIKMDSQKIYFPNLNGLRFIAALLVIIFHIEQFKVLFGLENYWDDSPAIRIIGKLGVVLFFVLSGFLITFLMLSEEKSFQSFSIRKFYIRRALRIWPLYFMIMVLAFAVIPHVDLLTLPGYPETVVYQDLVPKILLFVFFLPNLALSLYGPVPYAAHLWSIGTEEQFYLIWPWFLRWLKRFRIYAMLSIVIFYLVVAKFLATGYSDFIPYKSTFAAFWSSFNIDCMAIGGVYAILLFKNHPLLRILTNKWLFWVVLLTVVLLMCFGVYVHYVHFEFYSMLYGIIILNLAVNIQIPMLLETKILHHLGKISYGIYMYHPIAIVLALQLAIYYGTTSNLIIYPVSLFITIVLAAISFHFYEKIFLKFKPRFSKIKDVD